MKVHCLFEQSGTFKKVFIEKGYEAFDYDIENRFNETDFQLDLFKEIDKAALQQASIFDSFTSSDLLLAFFPCTYFSGQNILYFTRQSKTFENLSEDDIDVIIEARKKNQVHYLNMLFKLIDVINKRNLKLIIENPYHRSYLLTLDDLKHPDIVIHDRTALGDIFKKPTGFWFYNLEPTFFGEHMVKYDIKPKRNDNVNGIHKSLMTKDFAVNFINKYVLGG